MLSTNLECENGDVLKDTLENRGVLGQVKARIRAEIFAALDDNSLPPPKLSNENLIINELIREYLEYYKCSILCWNTKTRLIQLFH